LSGLIPKHFIDDLVSKTNIVDVIGSYLPLIKAGKNYKACCPFHKETTPSFNVNEEDQYYYCFGCSAGGNVLQFIVNKENTSFVQAVEKLAHLMSIEIPQDTAHPVNSGHKEIYETLENASNYYVNQLTRHPNAQIPQLYLKNRGLTQTIIDQFKIGFAPPGWDNLLKHINPTGDKEKLLHKTGLTVTNEKTETQYDRFRNRIMFPIRDTRGRITGFGGRVLGDDKPKYINSPESIIFHKKNQLYGLYEAKKANKELNSIIMVEGYMDVISLAQHGINNTVATLGTATSPEHLQTIFKLPHLSMLCFCFDGDTAGLKAAWHALKNTLPLMTDGRQVRFLLLPDGEDPDTMVKKYGSEAFLQKIQHSLTLDEYLFSQLESKVDTKTIDGCARLAKLAEPYFNKLPTSNYKNLLNEKAIARFGINLEFKSNQTNNTSNNPTNNNPSHNVIDYDHIEDSAYYHQEVYDNSSHTLEHTLYTDNQPYTSNNKSYQTKNNFKQGSRPSAVPKVAMGLIDRAYILLFKQPSLVQMKITTKLANTIKLKENTDSNMNELMHFIKSLLSNPNQSTSQLLGSWYGTPMGSKMTKLLTQDNLYTYDLQEEFSSVIDKIITQFKQKTDRENLDQLDILKSSIRRKSKKIT